MTTNEQTITGTCNGCAGRGKRGDGSRCTDCKGTGTITVLQSMLFRAQSKYGNEPVKAFGLSFDSQAEYRRFLELLELEREGEITQLKVHQRFGLYAPGPGGIKVRVAEYEADFCYLDCDGQLVIEDVKGALTDVYLLKKKWMAAQGYQIVEVGV